MDLDVSTKRRHQPEDDREWKKARFGFQVWCALVLFTASLIHQPRPPPPAQPPPPPPTGHVLTRANPCHALLFRPRNQPAVE